MKRTLTIFLSILCCLSARAQADGPYIFYNDDGAARVVSVSADGTVDDREMRGIGPGSVFTVTTDDGRYSFDVTLHENVRPQWKYSSTGRTFVTSDPHSDINSFVKMLQGNGVIGPDLSWSYGDGHLMVIGDVMDKGKDATQIFWLLYELEAEAEKAGGLVSFLYGNHEAMVLSGDYRYTDGKYFNLAAAIGCQVRDLMGPGTELGRWLATRNTIQQEDDVLFVHAGISMMVLEARMSVPKINEIVSSGLFLTRDEMLDMPVTNLLFSNYGPLWYRGLVLHYTMKYNPAYGSAIGQIMYTFDAHRMFVGHTIFKNVKAFYDMRVIDVNVDNRLNSEKGRSRAVLLDQGVPYVVDDNGRILRNFSFWWQDTHAGKSRKKHSE